MGRLADIVIRKKCVSISFSLTEFPGDAFLARLGSTATLLYNKHRSTSDPPDARNALTHHTPTRPAANVALAATTPLEQATSE